jgi:hypothetical protein
MTTKTTPSGEFTALCNALAADTANQAPIDTLGDETVIAAPPDFGPEHTVVRSVTAEHLVICADVTNILDPKQIVEPVRPPPLPERTTLLEIGVTPYIEEIIPIDPLPKEIFSFKVAANMTVRPHFLDMLLQACACNERAGLDAFLVECLAEVPNMADCTLKFWLLPATRLPPMEDDFADLDLATYFHKEHGYGPASPLVALVAFAFYAQKRARTQEVFCIHMPIKGSVMHLTMMQMEMAGEKVRTLTFGKIYPAIHRESCLMGVKV